MQAVILAGGRGTRIRGVDDSVPKPLIDVAGRPVIFRQVDALLAAGCARVFVLGGYLGELLRERLVGEYGDRVEVVIESQPLGSGGCLSLVRRQVVSAGETTLVVSGDLVFDVDLARLVEFHRRREAEVTLAVHPNNHPRDSDLVEADGEGRVTRLLLRPHPPGLRYHNLVNASIAAVEPRVWSLIADDTVMNLERDVFSRVGAVFAYRTPEYIKDMGTPERWRRAVADLEAGIVQARSLRHRQKAVFLDRDGVLNLHEGYVVSPAQLVLAPDAAAAVKRLNASAYLAIVVTNQPQLARNLCTWQDMDEIMKELETQLGDAGARLDDLLLCPHHPDGGFAGENPALKVACECRKPAPGMLLEAARRYNIDLASSFIIGDSWRDVEAGRRAGTRTILVRGDLGNDIGADHVAASVGSAVDHILAR